MKDHGEKHKRECAKIAGAIQEIEVIMSLPDGPERTRRLRNLMAIAQAEMRSAAEEDMRREEEEEGKG
jgi:hypothetical protein